MIYIYTTTTKTIIKYCWPNNWLFLLLPMGLGWSMDYVEGRNLVSHTRQQLLLIRWGIMYCRLDRRTRWIVAVKEYRCNH